MANTVTKKRVKTTLFNHYIKCCKYVTCLKNIDIKALIHFFFNNHSVNLASFI